MHLDCILTSGLNENKFIVFFIVTSFCVDECALSN